MDTISGYLEGLGMLQTFVQFQGAGWAKAEGLGF